MGIVAKDITGTDQLKRVCVGPCSLEQCEVCVVIDFCRGRDFNRQMIRLVREEFCKLGFVADAFHIHIVPIGKNEIVVQLNNPGVTKITTSQMSQLLTALYTAYSNMP
jgi:hypothetical protein